MNNQSNEVDSTTKLCRSKEARARCGAEKQLRRRFCVVWGGGRSAAACTACPGRGSSVVGRPRPATPVDSRVALTTSRAPAAWGSPPPGRCRRLGSPPPPREPVAGGRSTRVAPGGWRAISGGDDQFPTKRPPTPTNNWGCFGRRCATAPVGGGRSSGD